jgi:hypothetical protein
VTEDNLAAEFERLSRTVNAIAYQNKQVIYDLLFKAAAETMLAISADPKHLGACIAITAGAAHLGLGHDASSARARDRARRRPARHDECDTVL